MTQEDRTDEAGDPFDSQPPCPECGALNAADATFCADCGCKLVVAKKAAQKAAAEPPPLPGQKSRPQQTRPRRLRATKADAVEKARARQEFARTKNIVLTIRFVYGSCAVLALLYVLMWHSILSKLVDGLGSWYLPVTVLVYGQLALMVAGALFVLRAPLLWAIIGACYWTLNCALGWLGVWAGGVGMGLFVIFLAFQTLLSFAFWFAVGQAARVQRLLDENPELQIVRQRIDPSRRVEGGVADQARQRRRQERGNQWKGRLKIGGMVAVLLTVVITAIVFALRPPTVDATAASFQKAWGRSDLNGLVAQFAGDEGRNAKSLREGCERHGWLEALPALGEPKVETGSSRAIVEYSCAKGTLSAVFKMVDGVWLLTNVDLPPFDPPDVRATYDAFRSAWNAVGTDALVAMFRPATRERSGRSLAALLERRDWHEERPKLGGVDPGAMRDGRVTVLFGVDNDDMRVTFDYWHPNWHVVSLRPPR